METIIADRRVIATLGSGGMGTVYLVHHPRLPRQEALKVLPRGLSANESFRVRFQRESAILAEFDHPNIVRVYDCGEADGQLWLTMEYVAGQDAGVVLDTNGPMPTALVATVVDAVAAALDHAWTRAGLVHRDIKPANILIRFHGPAPVVKLADFGIAKTADGPSDLTVTGTTVGTMAYMAPEVIQGIPATDRADQYSLACTAYHLLTGQQPFVAPSISAVMHAHVTAPLPLASQVVAGISPAVDAVFARATAKDPAHRFASSSEFAAALRSALSNPPAETARLTMPSPYVSAPQYTAGPAAPSGRRPAVIAAIAAACVALLALVGLGLYFGLRDDPASTTTSTTVASGTSSTPASADDLSGLAGIWTGTYTCNQGETSLILNITPAPTGSLDATFQFGPTTANPTVPAGSYSMKAALSGDDLMFSPVEWINKPGDYLMVPIRATGPIDPGTRTLTGTVLSAGCTNFTVRR